MLPSFYQKWKSLCVGTWCPVSRFIVQPPSQKHCRPPVCKWGGTDLYHWSSLRNIPSTERISLTQYLRDPRSRCPSGRQVTGTRTSPWVNTYIQSGLNGSHRTNSHGLILVRMITWLIMEEILRGSEIKCVSWICQSGSDPRVWAVWSVARRRGSTSGRIREITFSDVTDQSRDVTIMSNDATVTYSGRRRPRLVGLSTVRGTVLMVIIMAVKFTEGTRTHSLIDLEV